MQHKARVGPAPEPTTEGTLGRRRRQGQKWSAPDPGQGKDEAGAEVGTAGMLLEPPLEEHHLLPATFGDELDLFSFRGWTPLWHPSCSQASGASLLRGWRMSEPRGRTPLGAWLAVQSGTDKPCWGRSGLGQKEDRRLGHKGGPAGGQPGRVTRSRAGGEAVRAVADLLKEEPRAPLPWGTKLKRVLWPGPEGATQSRWPEQQAANEYHPDGTVFLPSCRLRSGANMFGLDLPVVRVLQVSFCLPPAAQLPLPLLPAPRSLPLLPPASPAQREPPGAALGPQGGRPVACSASLHQCCQSPLSVYTGYDCRPSPMPMRDAPTSLRGARAWPHRLARAC